MTLEFINGCFGTSIRILGYALPVAPELRENLMRYPDSFAKSTEEADELLLSSYVVTVQVQQDGWTGVLPETVSWGCSRPRSLTRSIRTT
jgi:hypothetical protein